HDLMDHRYDAIPAVTNNEVITKLKGEYSLLEGQYAEKSRLYQADYPEMQRLKSQMTQIQERISQEMKDTYNKAVSAAKADYDESLNKETALAEQIEMAKRETVEGRIQALNYDQLQTELEKKKSMLDSLLTKQNETDVSADVDQKATPIRVVERAEIPHDIYSPKILRN